MVSGLIVDILNFIGLRKVHVRIIIQGVDDFGDKVIIVRICFRNTKEIDTVIGLEVDNIQVRIGVRLSNIVSEETVREGS